MRAPPNAETPAHRVDDDGRRNIERLGGVLDDLNTATPHADQDGLWLRRDFIRESGSIIASLGVSLAEAAWRGSDLTIEATLRQIIAVVKATATTAKEVLALSNADGQQ